MVQSKLTTRPLVAVLQDSGLPAITKSQKTATQAVELKDTAESAEQLRNQIEQLKTTQEKLLYVCSNGSDDDSLEVLQQIVNSEKTKLDKVVDKKNSGMSLLHILAARNKPQCLEFMLMHKVKVDLRDNVHATPLLHACAAGALEAAALLLSKGANVNARDTWGKFPLQVAVKGKHYKVAEMLASHSGTDVHLRGTKGNTVLHTVAAEGNLAGVQLLMEKCGASPQRRNNDEDNVLQLCLAHLDIVQYICQHTDKKVLTKMVTNMNIAGRNVIHECAHGGYYDSLISILKCMDLGDLSLTQVADLLNAPDSNMDTPLLLATKQSHKDIVKFLCQCTEVKKNIGDEDGNTALFHAASQKNTAIVDMLTSVGGSFKAENLENLDEKQNPVVAFSRSLRTILAVLLSAIAIFCILTIAAISIGFYASNVSKSTNTIRVKYFEEVITHLKNSIDETTKVHRMSFNDPGFNVTDNDSVLDTTANILFTSYEILPLVSLVYCSKGPGSFAGWIKNSVNSTMAYWSSNYNNYNLTTFVSVSDLKNYRTWGPGTIRMLPTRDKSEKIFNVLAKANNGTIWSTSYTSANNLGEIYLTLTRGFRDPDTNEFLGSCQFDFLTKGLSKYLTENAAQEPNSVTVIVEAKTGLLIGSSDPAVAVIKQTTNTTTRYSNSLGKNKRMDSLLKAARSSYGANLTSVPTDHNLYKRFDFNGKGHIMNIGSITDKYGLHWIVLQAMPVRNFYSRFFSSIIVLACATVVLVIFSFIIAAVVAALFMRPINVLMRQAVAIQLLQLETVENDLKNNMSYFTEVNSLQQAFRAMTSRLQQFRNFIPDHILAVIEAEMGAKKESDLKDKQSSHSKTASKDEVDTETNTHSISNPKAPIRNMVTQALNSGLTSGNVTMMIIRLPDFASVLNFHSASEIDETSKELLSQFMDVIRISQGQFVSISASKAVVAWNTFIKQHDHKTRACKTALKCMNILKNLHDTWKTRNLPLLEVNIAISSGNVFFGNMGTDRMKFFTVIGATAERASSMIKENAKWDVQLVCDYNVFQSTKDEFEMRPLYQISADQTEKPMLVYQIGDAKSADAWTKELGDQDESGGKWKEYNIAYDLYEKGQAEEAYEKFVQYLSHNVQDAAAQNMLALCKSQKEDTSVLTPTDPTSIVAEN